MPYAAELIKHIRGHIYETAYLGADVDLTAARAWVSSIEKEMETASKFFATPPTDAQIGAESRRVTALKNQGLELFPYHRNWIACRGAASHSWTLWWQGYRATYEGLKGAREETKRYRSEFVGYLADCKKMLVSPSALEKLVSPGTPVSAEDVTQPPPKLPSVKKRKIIGIWYNRDFDSTLSIEQVGQKYYEVSRFKGDIGGEDGRRLSRIDSRTFRPNPPATYGDHYVIQKNGDLAVRDREGLIDTLPRHSSLWPNSKEKQAIEEKQAQKQKLIGEDKKPALVQNQHINGDSWFGCTSKEYFQKLQSVVSQGDKEAFSRGLQIGLIAGQCVQFRSGEAVYIEDTAIFSGMVQVRRVGELGSYWTLYKAVENR